MEFRDGETSLLHVDFEICDLRPSIGDLCRVDLFAKEPILVYCSFHFRQQLSEIPLSFEMRRNDFEPVSRDNA